MINYTIDDITKPGWGIPMNEIWLVIRASEPAALLDRLKYLKYQDFLRTPYWYAVATLVKKRAGNLCQVCRSGKDLQVHHRGENYAIRGNEHQNMHELTCLCEKCHQKAHGIYVPKKKKKKRKCRKFSHTPGGTNWAAKGERAEWSSWKPAGRTSHSWKGVCR